MSIKITFGEVGRKNLHVGYIFNFKTQEIAIKDSQTFNFSMTSSVVFYYEYELHELYSMVRFGAFPFTRIGRIKSVESMQFLTFSSLRLDKCILFRLKKDRELSRDNYGIIGKSQKLEKWAPPSIILVVRRPQQWLTWQISDPCTTQIFSTLDCRISYHQGNHTESRIVWKSC